MALNTNGWDYIYTVNIQKLNDLIKTKGTTTLIDSDINNEVKDDNGYVTTAATFKITSLTITEFKVLSTSNYPNLIVSMELSGNYNSKNFSKLVLYITINIDWMNSYADNQTITLTDINRITTPIPTVTGLIAPELTSFLKIFDYYLNEKNLPTSLTTTRKYDKYYKFFASLNTFSSQKGCEWMKPTTQRFSVKRNVHGTLSDTSCFFSFSCMIDNHPNNDPGYVDLNAIPAGASSALVIERGVFAEHMVKAAFANGNKPLFKSANEKLEKNGAYSFSNNDKETIVIKKGTEVVISTSKFNIFFMSNK